MTDRISKTQRSWNMSRIRSRNSKIEKHVRSFLHKRGYRFRLFSSNLPGKPDIVLKKYKTVIFVHGCFWHHHNNCKRALFPKSNRNYWRNKFKYNKEKDKNNICKLKNQGWSVMIFWECEIINPKKFDKRKKETINLLRRKILTDK